MRRIQNANVVEMLTQDRKRVRLRERQHRPYGVAAKEEVMAEAIAFLNACWPAWGVPHGPLPSGRIVVSKHPDDGEN